MLKIQSKLNSEVARATELGEETGQEIKQVEVDELTVIVKRLEAENNYLRKISEETRKTIANE